VSSSHPDSAPPPKTREEFLLAPVGELADLWLVVTCGGCRQVTYRALGKPAFARHRGTALHEIFSRLRCSHCGGRAAAIRLANTMTGPLPGSSVAAWEIDLFP